MKKIIICAPSFDDKNGGAIVLHVLCHEIRNLGHEAFIIPYEDILPVSTLNVFRDLITVIKTKSRYIFERYKTSARLNTPIIRYNQIKKSLDDYIIIYPEVTFGNPFGAKNIVRWFLHKPDFHKGYAIHSPGEYYVRYDKAIGDILYLDNDTAEYFLKVIAYPLDLYSDPGDSRERRGDIYCVRKGRNRSDLKIPENALIIDDLPHVEVAKLFKRSLRFISYDTHTAYSRFAALCGCDSIVVPLSNVDKFSWNPDKKSRYGIAYGFDDAEIEWMRDTVPLLRKQLGDEQNDMRNDIKHFLSDVHLRFGN